MKKAKNKKLVEFWNKIKKPLMIISVVGNILFLAMIIVSCFSSKPKTQQVKAEDYNLTSLVGTSWILRGDLEEYEFDYSIDFESRETKYHMFRMVYSGGQMRLLYSQGLSVWSSNGNWSSLGYASIYIYGGEDVESPLLIQYLYDNAELTGVDSTVISNYESFTFNNQINYNAPYNISINSPFITHVFEQEQQVFTLVLNLPKFVSNGEIFNTIRLTYFSGLSTRYLDSGGIIRINENQNTAYYNYMEYLNTQHSTSVLVNYRNFVNDNVDGSVQTYLVNGSEWKNDNYRKLFFLQDLSSSQSTSLSQFNNQLIGYTGFNSGETNVGLGNVFALLGESFSSLKGILGISILPGLTIGLFLFLPLVVTIIIVIIKLVKR